MLTLEALCLSQFEVLEYLCQLKMYVRLFAHIQMTMCYSNREI